MFEKFTCSVIPFSLFSVEVNITCCLVVYFVFLALTVLMRCICHRRAFFRSALSTNNDALKRMWGGAMNRLSRYQGGILRRLVVATAFVFPLMQGPLATAAVIDTDLAITASVELGASPRFSDGNVSQTSSIHTVSGGTTSSNGFTTSPGIADTVNDAATTIPAPLLNNLTETGDGVGYQTSLTAGAIAGDAVGFSNDGYDFIINMRVVMQNNSATDTFTVTLQNLVNHRVDSDGVDAFSEIEVFLDQAGMAREILTDIISDTLLGDLKDGVPLVTAGAVVTDTDGFLRDYVLAPGEMITLDFGAHWKGAVFADPGAALSDSIFDVRVAEVACTGPTNCVDSQPPRPTGLPLPGGLLLLGLGLTALLVVNRQPSSR